MEGSCTMMTSSTGRVPLPPVVSQSLCDLSSADMPLWSLCHFFPKGLDNDPYTLEEDSTLCTMPWSPSFSIWNGADDSFTIFLLRWCSVNGVPFFVVFLLWTLLYFLNWTFLWIPLFLLWLRQQWTSCYSLRTTPLITWLSRGSSWGCSQLFTTIEHNPIILLFKIVHSIFLSMPNSTTKITEIW